MNRDEYRDLGRFKWSDEADKKLEEITSDNLRKSTNRKGGTTSDIPTITEKMREAFPGQPISQGAVTQRIFKLQSRDLSPMLQSLSKQLYEALAELKGR